MSRVEEEEGRDALRSWELFSLNLFWGGFLFRYLSDKVGRKLCTAQNANSGLGYAETSRLGESAR